MAHHAEPMDVDDESVFDNKENAYQNSNVLPRTPCTEKGYEELDVSELNMKLRYSITPATSPMSKSMSHCLDNRQNTLTDESINNTVINEYENNLTQSLNSTLNKTEVKSSKVLPLQTLPTDIVENNRSSVRRSLDAATTNDITITVSNQNEIDNLSFASSSSSMAHTPEATTPTKEMPKQDVGSPIMRGLKSVLSMFRSSQSPIPPGEEDSTAANQAVSPADVPLPDSKPRALASTPKNENNKGRSSSQRNSPHKESIVFNEDLEKELQWNDDSTIVFSSEKIPIHKLFFQDKPFKSAFLNDNVKHEDANSTVEYMDVSYNDLSIKDKTLNGNINKNKVNELVESDGEFVDCETTFTQDDVHFQINELDAAKPNNSQIPNVAEKLEENTANEPFTLDTTKDIMNSIDTSHMVLEENVGKPHDATTDIVNQLSDLINESETSASNVISVENKGTAILGKEETSTLSYVQTQNNILPELLQNQVASPVNSAIDSPIAATEQKGITSEDLIQTSSIVCDTITHLIESTQPKISVEPVEAVNMTQISSSEVTKTIKEPEERGDSALGYPSPVDIPLPNDDDINEIADNVVCVEFHDKDMLNASGSQNALMAALNKSITEVNYDIQHTKAKTENNVTVCPHSILPSDVPLFNTDAVDTNNIPHEAITVICDPVQSPVIDKPDTSVDAITAKGDLVNDEVDKSAAEATADIPHAQIEADIPCPPCPNDTPVPGMDDDNPTKTDDLPVDAVTMDVNSVRQCIIENPEVILVVNDSNKIKTDIVFNEIMVADNILPTDMNKSKEGQMEISYVECAYDKLSLFNTDAVDTNNIPHEAITVICDPVQSPVIDKPDTSVDAITAKGDLVNDEVDKSAAEATADIPHAQIEADIPCPPCPNDTPVPGMDDDNPTKTDDLPVDAVTKDVNSVRQCIIENPEVILVVNDSNKIKTDIVFNEITVADNILPTDINKSKKGQMEISYVECAYDKLSENYVMDVSMKMEDTLDQPESCLKETQTLKIMPEIPEVNSKSIEVNPTDIVKGEVKSSRFQIASEKGIDETVNSVSNPVSVTAIAKHLTNAPKSQDSLNGNVIASVALITSASEPSNAPPISDHSHVTNIAGANNEASIVNGSNLNHVLEDAAGIASTVTTLLNDQDSNILLVPTVSNKKEACFVEEDTALPGLPKYPDTISNLDLSCKVESTPECVDEEIVLSESNSPFVSMSAEEPFDHELKKEEFENILQPPPISPKIVSKGYNINFDDIDNINPFATNTKIRLSPPPGVSPNTLLVTEDVNKIATMELSKNDKNINRRKSMPERKKPLKAKRHLNSTINGIENRSSKITILKNDVPKNTPKIEPQHEQTHLNQADLKQTDIDNVRSVTQDVISDKLNVTIPVEITTNEEKDHKEPEAAPSVDDPKENTSIRAENETNTAPNNEIKLIDDFVMSASSSEQCTYLSVGASSTEPMDSKNVFNLPELDDFNPFATKSRIRQTPPRDLDIDNPFATKSEIQSSPEISFVVTQKDSNSTVTIGNEIELKEAKNNLSTCSGSSKTSQEKDITVHEVHTEDEDTLEGPFLEADDGDEGEKAPEFTNDKVDVVDFDNRNQPDNDEAAEMFIDAEAFEFLMNQNKADEVAYSGKESLFLKFDPLFAQRVTSEGVSAALNDIKRKQMTPKKAPKQAPLKEVELMSLGFSASSDLNISSEVQNVVEERPDINVTTSKPMMVVTPVTPVNPDTPINPDTPVNSVVTLRKSLTPNRSNRLSMTFTSPAMAVIDRLLSLSGNSAAPGLDTTITHVDRSHCEADQALTQLRELLAEKEINVYNLRCESKELRDRLITLETRVKSLEAESAERLKKVNELTENLAEKTKMNRNLTTALEEYERTIATLVSEMKRDKKRFAEERNQLISDRDEQNAHLSSMEAAFEDLYSKYEKSSQVIINYETIQEDYKKSIQEFEDKVAKMQTRYEQVKQHAYSSLNHANQELEKINKAHESEVLKYNAMIKRKELHIKSLEESLAQKTKANEDLTAICDDLINRVR